jgi:hypothetical protein
MDILFRWDNGGKNVTIWNALYIVEKQ